MKFKDLKWYEKAFQIMFGGCLGCFYTDCSHNYSVSLLHVNQKPTTEQSFYFNDKIKELVVRHETFLNDLKK